MSDDRSREFALIIRAMQDLAREMASTKAEWKDRSRRLENQLAKLSGDVLSGQLPLIPEEPASQNGNGHAERVVVSPV